MKNILFFLGILICFTSCKKKENNSIYDNADKKEQIEKNNSAKEKLKELSLTHKNQEYKSHKAIRFHVKSSLDKPDLRISLSTDLNRFKIQTEDSKYLYFDGREFYSSTENISEELLEYMLSTIYYFSLPYHIENLTEEVISYKTTDSLFNTDFSSLNIKVKENTLHQEKENAIKVFTAPDTKFLTAIKFSTSSKEEQVLFYQNYFSIGKIIVAKHWHFYNLNKKEEENPILTEKITLSRVNFFSPEKDFFKVPKNVNKINITR